MKKNNLGRLKYGDHIIMSKIDFYAFCFSYIYCIGQFRPQF